MNPHEPSILERNLVALFRAAYRPVRADRAFLDGLRATFLAEMTARQSAPAPRAIPLPRRVHLQALPLAAAAGLLVALCFALWPAGSKEPTTRERPQTAANANGERDPRGNPLGHDQAEASARLDRELGPTQGLAASEGERAPRRAPLAPSSAANATEGPVEQPATPADPEPELLEGLARVSFRASPAGPSPLRNLEVATLEVRGWPEVVVPRLWSARAGEALWADLKPGRYEIFARAEGFAALGPIEVDLGPSERRQVELHFAPARTLAVRVQNQRGEGIPDATVILESAAPPRVVGLDPRSFSEFHADFAPHASSGPDGRLRLGGLGTEPCALRASAPGYGPAWRIVDGSAEEVELVLPPAATIAGRVDAPHGGPWVGASLVATFLEDPAGSGRSSFATALVDHLGQYRLEGLAAGQHVVLLFPPPEPGTESQGPMHQIRHVATSEGQVTAVDFALGSTRARLRGQIVDGDGQPVSELSVGLWRDDPAAPGPMRGRWIAAVTDGRGEFQFDDLEAGPWVVFVSRALEDHMTAIAWPTVQSRAESELRLVLPAGGIRVLPRGPLADLKGQGALILWRREPDGSRTFAGRAVSSPGQELRLFPLPPGNYALELYGERGLAGELECSVESTLDSVELHAPTPR